MNSPRLIAYYLPQYHPIPENDAWWGNGFTEWTNVAKAKPLFRGHYQPHIPADLGFYDLRVPEVREAQATLAREAGIEGFCYWHYWFGGKRLLERPFDEVLASGKPDFPFCLAWANASWTGIWYGAGERILQEQTYPGMEDHRAHFEALLPAFQDPRYIRVDGKPLFLIFQPMDLSADVIAFWQRLALSAGLPGIHFTGIVNNIKEAQTARQNGFKACTISRTSGRGTRLSWDRELVRHLLGNKRALEAYQKLFHKPFHVYDSRKALPYINIQPPEGMDFYPCVLPGWDNTPRAGLNGQVFLNSSPEIFREHLEEAWARVADYPPEHQIIILKSWNEWAEGNYLEPDQRFGTAFLDALKEFTQTENKDRFGI
ncbi:MAG TPA: glycoside hydrolase family 99-like domain-containing protein [Anaerolineaceae bacterium]|nr:lipopolysaccharide biosynthesis protein [Anaerolineaceae bacterium]HOV30189.1 glycoside hydrolase family 99-like domain-containing protein [Anaerolineaceae bacterium]HUM49669.1 glycoside hydrolase family 99-like domain-containing protein [Anaerolineaceae bacterium]